ncbi:tetratricopeptide repeat protein [bacterium]|nr:tetratricopeptide repeat protein [bacterium]
MADILDKIPTNKKETLDLAHVAYFQRGDTLRMIGKYSEAEEDYKKSKLCATDKEKEYLAEIHIASLLYRRGEFKSALDLLNQLEGQVDRVKDHTAMHELYITKANVLKYMARYDEAGKYFEKILSASAILAESPDSELRILASKRKYSALVGIAFLKSMLGEYEECLEMLNDSLRYFTKENSIVVQIQLILEIAGVNSDLGNFKSAVKNYKKAIGLAKKIFVKSHIHTAYYNLIRVYVMTGDYESAQNNIDYSIELAEELGDLAGLSYSLLQKAVILKDMCKLNAAVEIFLEGLEIAKNVGDPVAVSAFNMNLGETYYFLGQEARAKRYLKKAYKIAKEIKNYYMVITSLDYLAYVLLSLGDHKAAFAYNKDLEKLAGAGDQAHGNTLSQFMRLLLLKGNSEEASSIADGLEKQFAASANFDYRTYIALIEYYMASNQEPKAERFLSRYQKNIEYQNLSLLEIYRFLDSRFSTVESLKKYKDRIAGILHARNVALHG